MSVVASDGMSSQQAPRIDADPHAAAQPLLGLLRDHAEATFLLAPDATIVLAGGATRGLLGHDSASLAKRPLVALVHEDDHPALRMLFDGGPGASSADTLLRFTSSDRLATRQLAVRAAPVVMAAGTASLLVTARERATSSAIQAALRRDMVKMASFAEQSPFAVFLLDGRGRCVAMNTVWHLLSGQPAADALGLGWLQLIDARDRAGFREVAASAHRARIGWRQTFRISRADHRSVTIDAGAAPLIDHDGSIAGYVGVLVDLTALTAPHRESGPGGIDDALNAAWTPAVQTTTGHNTGDAPSGAHFATPESFSPERVEPISPDLSALTVAHQLQRQLRPTTQQLETTEPEAQAQTAEFNHTGHVTAAPPTRESSLSMPLGQLLGTEPDTENRTADFCDAADLPLQRPMPSSYGETPDNDPITGLGNYALFQSKVEEAFARVANEGVSMLCIRVALVGFETVRSRLGEKVGDDYLYVLGKRVASIIRSVDAAARVEGEEFAILSVGWFFPGDMETVVTRFLRRLGEPLPSKAGDECFGPAIGVALLQPGDTCLTLMKRATRAQARALAIGAHHAVIDTGADSADIVL